MLHLTDDEVASGVVAVSGGNHGLAVAYAARELGIAATVLMPSTTAAGSVRQARADGAEVNIGETIADVFAQAVHEVEAGKVMIHPFDDPAVIAGQGTLALELYEDAPDDHRRDRLHRWRRHDHRRGDRARGPRPPDPDLGCRDRRRRRHDPVAAGRCAGHPRRDHLHRHHPGRADGLGADAGRGAEAWSRRCFLVSDAEAVHGVDAFAQAAKLITEPAAGATWAAALRLRDRLPADARVALIVCGGNACLDDIAGWRSRFL